MTDLLGLIAPHYTDDEQLGSKAMQQGFESLRRKLSQEGRVVLTWHGRPEAVVLSYQDMKKLWGLISEMAENQDLVSLIETRAASRSSHRVEFEEGIARIRNAWMNSSDEG